MKFLLVATFRGCCSIGQSTFPKTSINLPLKILHLLPSLGWEVWCFC